MRDNGATHPAHSAPEQRLNDGTMDKIAVLRLCRWLDAEVCPAFAMAWLWEALDGNPAWAQAAVSWVVTPLRHPGR